MGFISSLLMQMERSTAGSEATTRTVMRLCDKFNGGQALFFGDDLFTPKLISEVPNAKVTAAFYEDFRVEKALQIGLTAQNVGAFEILRNSDGWDFVWFNGSCEPDGVERRFEQLKSVIKPKKLVVYRTLCWLIDPSPDTQCYVEHRFGCPERLDSVIFKAKEQGFNVLDFVISPKTDWTLWYYSPMSTLIKQIEGEYSGDERSGVGEFNKEVYMFDLHSEEYSFVYFILES